METYDLRFFIGKSYFSDKGSQNYMIFQPVNNILKWLTDTKKIVALESKGLPPDDDYDNDDELFLWYG